MTEPAQPAAPPRPRFQFTLRTLFLLFVVLASSLGVFGGWGIPVFVSVVSVAVCICNAKSPLIELAVLVLILLFLIALLGPALQPTRESGRQAQCYNNLHLIGRALQAYHDENGCFPPAYLADNNGKPLLSWRMLILPYLERSDLYTMYKFNEPWDGPNNKKPSAARVSVYKCPSDPSVGGTANPVTSYVAVAGTNAAWTGDKSRKLSDFGDDASDTIIVVEVLHSGIAWAEPKDLSLDQLDAEQVNQPALVVASNHNVLKEFLYANLPTGVNAVMADGSVRFISLDNQSPEQLRKLLEIGGLRSEGTGVLQRRLNWPNIAALAVWLLSVAALLTKAVRSRKAMSEIP
jgi:type II secretory pathway pseudopilin PulG